MATAPWLDSFDHSRGTTYRAEIARQLDCAPADVEARMASRDAAIAKACDRIEYEDPCGHQRNRRW